MRRIAQETINRVLEEVDIFEVISQYVDLKKRGKNYFGLSPFRSETKPSFSVALKTCGMTLVLAKVGMQYNFL